VSNPQIAAPATVVSTSLPVLGMTCAACVRRVETAIGRVPGVSTSEINFPLSQAHVVFDPVATSLREVAAAIRAAGYEVPADALEPDRGDAELRVATDDATFAESNRLRSDVILAAALTLPLLVVAMSHGALGAWLGDTVNLGLQALLGTIVVLGPGRRFFVAGWSAARHRSADMNTLIALGTGAAWIYSAVAAAGWLGSPRHHLPALYFEAATAIVSFVLLGKFLETRARKRLSDAVRGLVSLEPPSACRVRDDEEREVSVAELVAGDVVIVRPGQRVSADGTVTAGDSAVDESMLTGESLPSEKHEGSAVYAGTLNQGSAATARVGALTIRVARAGRSTALARIARAVEEAQGQRAPIARLADRVSAWFVPVVLAIAALAFAVWLAADPTATGAGNALERFVAVLVIACPCALGLATPAAVAVGTSRGAELGVLFKGGSVLEAASHVDAVMLDKTGTVTAGKPAVTRVVDRSGRGEDHLVAAVASLEQDSEHPVARAILAEAARRTVALSRPANVHSYPGEGVDGVVTGVTVQAGNRNWLVRLGIDTSAVDAVAEELAVTGQSPVYVALDGKLAGLLAVADPPAKSAMAAVAALRALGVEPVMLTGDRESTARWVASALAIDDVRAELRPLDKLRAIQEAQAQGKIVAMVGDGINDAPALATANVGIAMGTGTDVAAAAADITLLRDGISGLPLALRLARATMRNIRQNLFWAFIYNVVGIPIAAGALYPINGWLLSPILASAAMSLSSVSVLTNSLRLRRWGRD
jgi:Cu+-exporting ATPase